MLVFGAKNALALLMRVLFLTCGVALLLPACREKNPGIEESATEQLTKPSTTTGTAAPRGDDNQPAAIARDSSGDLVAFLASKPDSEERKKAQATLQAEFDLFAKDHPDRTAAFREFCLPHLTPSEPGPERDGLIEFLMPVAGAEEYREKLALLFEFYSNPSQKGWAIESVFSEAAKHDPAGAYEAASKIDEPKYRHSAYRSTTTELCRECESFPEAIKLVAGFMDGRISDDLMWAITQTSALNAPLPTDLRAVLEDVFTTVECSQSARNHLVNALAGPMSQQGMVASVTFLNEFEITSPEAWGVVANNAQDINPETARLFLENVPEEASVQSCNMLLRLQEKNGAEAMWQTLSALQEDRQESFAPKVVPFYAHFTKVGVSQVVREAREALTDEAFVEAMKSLASWRRSLKMSPEEIQALQTAIEETQKQILNDVPETE